MAAPAMLHGRVVRLDCTLGFQFDLFFLEEEEEEEEEEMMMMMGWDEMNDLFWRCLEVLGEGMLMLDAAVSASWKRC